MTSLGISYKLPLFHSWNLCSPLTLLRMQAIPAVFLALSTSFHLSSGDHRHFVNETRKYLCLLRFNSLPIILIISERWWFSYCHGIRLSFIHRYVKVQQVGSQALHLPNKASVWSWQLSATHQGDKFNPSRRAGPSLCDTQSRSPKSYDKRIDNWMRVYAPKPIGLQWFH